MLGSWKVCQQHNLKALTRKSVYFFKRLDFANGKHCFERRYADLSGLYIRAGNLLGLQPDRGTYN